MTDSNNCFKLSLGDFVLMLVENGEGEEIDFGIFSKRKNKKKIILFVKDNV